MHISVGISLQKTLEKIREKQKSDKDSLNSHYAKAKIIIKSI